MMMRILTVQPIITHTPTPTLMFYIQYFVVVLPQLIIKYSLIFNIFYCVRLTVANLWHVWNLTHYANHR